MERRISVLALFAALAGLGWCLAGPVAAQTSAPDPKPPTGAGNQPDLGGTPQTSDQPAAQGTPDQGNPSIHSSLGSFCDPGGLRASLAQYGVTYSLVLIGEGRLDLQLNIDLAKAIGLTDATLHANGYRIFGDGLSRSDLLNLSLASGIEALKSTRLYEV